MFAKWFNLIFGIGAGVVATMTLAGAVIVVGVWLIDWIESQNAENEFRTTVCQDLPEDTIEGKAYYIENDALTDAQKRERLEYFRHLASQRKHLSKIRTACSN